MIYYQKRRDLIPCEVVYCKERFYLKCVNAATQQLRIYRIDRMKDICAGESFENASRLTQPEGAVVDIYEPERYEIVKLRVKRVLLDDMLEQLGRYVSICPDLSDQASPEWIVLRANIGISFGFYRWLLKYGSDIEVLSPEDVPMYIYPEPQENDRTISDVISKRISIHKNPHQTIRQSGSGVDFFQKQYRFCYFFCH